jgi:hypothetical protein
MKIESNISVDDDDIDKNDQTTTSNRIPTSTHDANITECENIELMQIENHKKVHSVAYKKL